MSSPSPLGTSTASNPPHIQAARDHIRTTAIDRIAAQFIEAMSTPALQDASGIPGVLDAIRLAWTATPDVRLAQIIIGAGATFNTEDDELVERVLGLHRRK